MSGVGGVVKVHLSVALFFSEGEKNGRRRTYAVECFSNGYTRSVPSPGPVSESPSQPCQRRSMLHAPGPLYMSSWPVSRATMPSVENAE